MPAPTKVRSDELIAAASAQLEEGGLASLTMAAVATRLGVRAPSLYKHVRDRDGLIALVRSQAFSELSAALLAVQETDARQRIAGFADATRAFADERPHTYDLIFRPISDPTEAHRTPHPATASTAAPLLSACAELAGDEDALHAARTVTSWLFGFISRARADGFALGGDLEAAYRYGRERIIDAITRSARG
ncbi:TetR/AcrR family transcriptional regulator [Microbacterium sp. ZW T5_56]|uniref:TetR/AcrR family transcriptional regulator n=1 Tax=Microbacterium sp. ZW T5_56 TaxID=3378081 RepID=UPI0038537684